MQNRSWILFVLLISRHQKHTWFRRWFLSIFSATITLNYWFTLDDDGRALTIFLFFLSFPLPPPPPFLGDVKRVSYEFYYLCQWRKEKLAFKKLVIFNICIIYVFKIVIREFEFQIRYEWIVMIQYIKITMMYAISFRSSCLNDSKSFSLFF